MTASRADSLRALAALSVRLRDDFELWLTHHGDRAPQAARSIARLSTAIAQKMAADVQTHEASRSQGKSVDVATVIGLAKRAQLAEELHTILDHSTYQSLHPVLSPTVRNELSELGLSGSVLVSGTREASYELLRLTAQRFANLADAAELKKISWPIWIFRIPHRPLDWPLHHVLVYHELGHALYKRLPIPKPPELQASRSEPLKERMLKAQKQLFYDECMASWMEEVFADSIGVLLAGPAYAIAFSRFLGTFFKLEAASKTHPPTALRIELINQLVRDKNFDSGLEQEGQDLLLAWDKDVATITNYTTGDLALRSMLTLVVRDLKKSRKAIISAASQAVQKRIFDAKWIPEDVERGRWMHELAVPAIETDMTGATRSEPLSPSRSFSAGWMAFLHAVRTEPPNRLPQATHSIAEVLLGSLEGSHALRSWRENG